MTEGLLQTEPHLERIRGAAVWDSASFPDSDAYTYRLKPATIVELERSIAAITKQGKDLSTVARRDFPVPSFAADVPRLDAEIRCGRGFVLVKGLPADRCSDDELTLMYWGLGSHLGPTLAQNLADDRVYAVTDAGKDLRQATSRGSKTSAGLDFHTDSAPAFRGVTPAIVALLCLRAARSGGESMLLSAATLHNLLLEASPEALVRLYEPYHWDRRAELADGEEPTIMAPVFTYDGRLAVRYASLYLLRGHEVARVPLWTDDIIPIVWLQVLMQRPELHVTFSLEPGDALLASNRSVLHARTAFVDHDEPAAKRNLVRMWLADNDREP